METCKVSKIVHDQNFVNPVLLNFKNGLSKPIKNDILSSQLYESPEHRIAAVVANDALYMGTVNEDSLYNNYLAIKKHGSNEVHLIAVDKASLMQYESSKESDVLDSAPNEEKKAAMINLRKTFGSKKDKRRTEQFERMIINVENVKEVLEKTVADIEIDEADIAPAKINENESAYQPPINRNASSIEKVYLLENLVPLNLLEEIENQTEKVLQENEDTLTKLYSPFVVRGILKLRNSKVTNKEHKCSLLLYIDCLFKIALSSAKNISTKNYNPCPYSNKLGNYILDHFTVKTKSGRCRPISMKDKTLCYILVLSVIVNSYSVNLEELSKDLKVGLKKLLEVSRVLSLSKSKDNTVHLKLPLPQPLLSNTNSSKRRKL